MACSVFRLLIKLINKKCSYLAVSKGTPTVRASRMEVTSNTERRVLRTESGTNKPVCVYVPKNGNTS